MFVYFPVLVHVCDVNVYATRTDLSRVLRFGSVDGNAKAERIRSKFSTLEGGFRFLRFLSPKNAVTVLTKGTSDKYFVVFARKRPLLTGALITPYFLSTLKAGVCLISFLVGLVFTLGSGNYWLEIFNSYVGSVPLLIIAFCELIGVIYFYGMQK